MQTRLDWSRQLHILPPTHTGATVVGLGHLGSAVAMALAKMGIGCRDSTGELVLWDGDIVGTENILASMYSPRSIGRPKATALQELIEMMCPTRVRSVASNFTRTDIIDTPILVVATDDLPTRKFIVEAALRDVEFVVDVRSGLWQLDFFAFRPEMAEEKSKWDASFNGPVEELPCGGRAVAFNSFTAAGIVAGIVTSFLRREAYPVQMTVDHRTWSFIKYH